jgi:hypothetical protein
MPLDPACDAAALLGRLFVLLDGGRCWAQGEFAGEHERYCLRGGLDHLRGDCAGGLAEMLLLAAVKERCGYEVPIVQFNDSADSFEEVRQVIARARHLAETCAPM